MLPSAVVSEVARRHDLSLQHLSVWRKAARSGLLKLLNGTMPAATRPSGSSAAQDISASSRQAPGVFGGPGPGHEFIQTRSRPKIDQLGENVGQVGLRLDAAELAGLCQNPDLLAALADALVFGRLVFAAVEACPEGPPPLFARGASVCTDTIIDALFTY